ncbi:unnamed protein product [Ostreobium quekettii]|uniref:Uncharacterized protein n=1 Tax=Ostreobium quekettii TaxID=121088 RepID=A0A8S1J6M2_9CHLO|nr:unnamed protein product [Ostreobium quekettii]
MALQAGDSYDLLFKVLLVGDSAVGKSCLLMRFTTDRFDEHAASTIGVDFKIKYVTLKGQKLKLTIWDTAGQERFRTLTSSYYRGAQGIIFVYDVTRRETFESLGTVWLNEVEMYSTIEDAVKMVVANKVDMESNREVSKEEGTEFARQHGCLFVETSAKTNIAVQQAFEELVLKILDTPSLLTNGRSGLKIGPSGPGQQQPSSCC